MKKTNIYLVLSVLAVIVLTLILGYSLKKYYKKSEPPYTSSTEQSSEVILKDLSYNSLNYVTVENQKGSFTVMSNGDTLLIDGMEGLPLDDNALNTFARALTKVEGTKLEPSADKLEKYGINGDTSITAHYIDNSTLTFRFGRKLADKIPCYIDETSEVFLFPSDYLPERSYSPENFVKRNVSPSVDTDDTISSVTLSGKCRPMPIRIEQNENIVDDEPIKYNVTAPLEAIVSKSDVESALGTVFDIKADSIICLEATPDDIKAYHFDEPFSIMDISTKQLSFSLKATEADKNGYFYIMSETSPSIYKVSDKNMGWLTAQYGDIVKTFFIPPEITEISSFTVTTEDKAIVFDLQKQIDDCRILCMGKEINCHAFSDYLKKITSIPPKEFLNTETEVQPTLEIKIEYSKPDSKPEKIAFIPDGEIAYISVDGEIRYTIPRSSVEMIVSETMKIIS